MCTLCHMAHKTIEAPWQYRYRYRYDWGWYVMVPATEAKHREASIWNLASTPWRGYA